MSAEPADALVLGPGEGERHQLGESSLSIKAGAAETAGTFYCGEAELAPGYPGPPAHVHERLHDMFYVLEGTLRMRVGDEQRQVGAGSFVCVPPGVVHTFSNPGSERVRLLNFNTPGGFEGYMRELAAGAAAAAARGEQLSSAEIGTIAARHDFRAL